MTEIATAPNHSEAKQLGLRFRHLHRGGWGETKRLGGTLVCESEPDGTVTVAMVVVNPNDKQVSRAEGRDRAYARLREGRTVRIPLRVFKARLADGSLPLFIADLTLEDVPRKTVAELE